MRVGLLTSYFKNEKAAAYLTLPIMKRYCSIRGYTLVVGVGMSADGMYEGVSGTLDPHGRRGDDQYETATLFLPIWSVIMDPRVKFEHLGKGQRLAPPGLAVICAMLADVRDAIATAPWLKGYL